MTWTDPEAEALYQEAQAAQDLADQMEREQRGLSTKEQRDLTAQFAKIKQDLAYMKERDHRRFGKDWPPPNTTPPLKK